MDAQPASPACTPEPDFRINGVRYHDEPYPYLDQAHAVACCLDEALSEEANLNSDILRSAARAIETLIHLAAESLDNMDKAREARRHGRA